MSIYLFKSEVLFQFSYVDTSNSVTTPGAVVTLSIMGELNRALLRSTEWIQILERKTL